MKSFYLIFLISLAFINAIAQTNSLSINGATVSIKEDAKVTVNNMAVVNQKDIFNNKGNIINQGYFDINNAEFFNKGVVNNTNKGHIFISKRFVNHDTAVNKNIIATEGQFVNRSSGKFKNIDTLSVKGHFRDSGRYYTTLDTSLLALNSNNQQDFYSKTSFAGFNDIALNGGGLKKLDGSVRINGNLLFLNGHIKTNVKDTLFVDSLGTISFNGFGAPSDTSYVKGRLYRKKKNGSSKLYFPVGNLSKFRPVVLDSVTSSINKPVIQMAYRDIGFGVEEENIDLDTTTNNYWKYKVLQGNYSKGPVTLSYKNGDFSPAKPDTNSIAVAQTDSLENPAKWKGLGQGKHVTSLSSARPNFVKSAFAATQQYLTLGTCKNIKLNIKAWLQGPYNTSTNLMNKPVNDTLKKYYGPSGLKGLNMYANTTIPDSAVDVIQVYLRETASGNFIDTSYAWLLQNGSIKDFYTGTKKYITFCNTPPGNYHVVLRHRNHLAVMSSTKPSLDGENANTIDFTGIAVVYGAGEATLEAGEYGMFAGNARNDNEQVNAGDLFDVLENRLSMKQGYRLTDMDFDLITNADDYDITNKGNSNLYFSTVPGL